MDRTERFYKIEKLLRQHKTVSFAALQLCSFAALQLCRQRLIRRVYDEDTETWWFSW